MTERHRGAYTCASYITVSLDEMEKMSGSISGSVLHQCATLREFEGEIKLGQSDATAKIRKSLLKRESACLSVQG